MARIRTIKPEFPQSESMGRVSRDSRLLFIELWTLCDDAGRARANSRMLASLLFPYDGDAPKHMDGWLDELEKEGCLTRYLIGSDHYVEVCNWLKHQRIDHPSKSNIPSPTEASVILASPRENSCLDQGPRTKDRTKDQGLSRASARGEPEGFKEFYQSYPKKVGRRAAAKAYGAAITRNEAATILVAASVYATASQGQERKFIPHPATWLARDGWLDELEPQGNGHAARNGKPPTAHDKFLAGGLSLIRELAGADEQAGSGGADGPFAPAGKPLLSP